MANTAVLAVLKATGCSSAPWAPVANSPGSSVSQTMGFSSNCGCRVHPRPLISDGCPSLWGRAEPSLEKKGTQGLQGRVEVERQQEGAQKNPSPDSGNSILLHAKHTRVTYVAPAAQLPNSCQSICQSICYVCFL